MSGYKRATVTISEQEYRRLHEADMQKRFGSHKKAKKKSSKEIGDLANSVQQMENRQQQLEQALGTLAQESSSTELETMQDIMAQNSMCYERLEEIIAETRSGFSDSFSSLSQHFAERFQEEREQFRHEFQDLARRLDAYHHKEQAREQLARQWLRRAVILSEFIQDHFAHERFLPGRLSKIMRHLDFAQVNLAAGSEDASLQISQQSFLELSELHFELERCMLEWQTEYEHAQTALQESLDEIQLGSNVKVLDLKGEALPGEVDVNYWSNGKYRLVLEQCQQFLAVLSEEQLSTEELRRVHTDVVPTIMQYFDSVVYEVRLNALNSQLRMNIAERALQALENQGFRLTVAGYTQSDMRGSFTVQLENADGSQVSIEILPVDARTQELTNEMIVITKHPYLKTEQEARLQWEELCRTFQQYNLNVSRPEVRATENAPVQQDVENPAMQIRPRVEQKRRSDVR